MEHTTSIELLAPAGDADAFKAAVAAGASAVYFGLEKFSARTRAKNITFTELARLMPIAKAHGVKTYVTLNTLLTDDELESACALIKEAVRAGIDAVIVQDTGVLSRLQQELPQLELHASTQMTTHNIGQCRFLLELGVSQVNLSRELSLHEIAPLSQFLIQHGIVSEVFVHGAYCISFSGQCYLSGALYGEAGNRGSCVQPCRRRYRVKPSALPLAPFYLKDNCAFPLAQELISAGAGSLKIEGRIKNAEYVWAVTSAWRKQLDTVASGGKAAESSANLSGAVNRDFSADYLRDSITANMFSDGEKDNSLQNAGEVLYYRADSSRLTVQHSRLKEGDHVSIKAKDGTFICTGVITSCIDSQKNENVFTLHISNKLAGKILPGCIVWRSTSVITPEKLSSIIKALETETSDEAENTQHLLPLTVCVSGTAGEKLRAVFTADCTHHGEQDSVKSAEVFSRNVLENARSGGLNETTLKEKLGRLGGTEFFLKDLDATELQARLFVPPADLNAMRREATDALSAQLQLQKEEGVLPCAENDSATPDSAQQTATTKEQSLNSTSEEKPFKLAFVCATVAQAETLADNGFQAVLNVPLGADETFSDFLLKRADIIPLFEPVLIGEDFVAAELLVQKLAAAQNRENSKRRIWCENSGLAHSAREQGLSLILGSNLNITNSCAVASYCTSLHADAFVPSIEIAAQTVAALRIPDGCSMWFPLYEHERLMQSRQCLLRQLTNCTKPQTDRNCIFSCSKECAFEGMNGEKLLACKRAGFYSALYRQRIVSNAIMMPLLKRSVSVWTVDVRFFGGNVLALAEKLFAAGTSGAEIEALSSFERRHFSI